MKSHGPDIIERLRAHRVVARVSKDAFGNITTLTKPCPLAQEAAQEIRMLRHELAKLRATREGRKRPYNMTSLTLARLEGLIDYMENNPLPPTIDTLRGLWGLRTYSSVDKTLRVLEARGYITRQRHARRGITVLKKPNGRSYNGALETFNGRKDDEYSHE